jgi:predicted DNA repair protein MutK
MSGGLIALLDDVLSMTKAAAAAGADDIVDKSRKTISKGKHEDAAEVKKPRSQHHIPPEREIPVIKEFARASVRNKSKLLLPTVAALRWMKGLIVPALMIGGATLNMEATESLHHKVHSVRNWLRKRKGLPAHVAAGEGEDETPITYKEFEDETIKKGAKTDFVMSMESLLLIAGVMAQKSNDAPPIFRQIGMIGAAALGVTAVVYGGVVPLVRGDDWAKRLAAKGEETNSPALAGFGRGLDKCLKGVKAVLPTLGMFALFGVGGECVLKGFPGVEHAIGHIAEKSPWAWGAEEAMNIGVGMAVGEIMQPVSRYILEPLKKTVGGWLKPVVQAVDKAVFKPAQAKLKSILAPARRALSDWRDGTPAKSHGGMSAPDIGWEKPMIPTGDRMAMLPPPPASASNDDLPAPLSERHAAAAKSSVVVTQDNDASPTAPTMLDIKRPSNGKG